MYPTLSDSPSWTESSAVRQIKRKFEVVRGRYRPRKGITLTEQDKLAVAYLGDVWGYKFKSGQ
jgi:hypothetical protein